MESITSIFKEHVKFERNHVATIRSERDEGIKRFFDKKCINVTDRQTKQLRLANLSEIALILRNCPTSDLYPFFTECERATIFSRYFWWATKGGKAKKKQPLLP